VKKSHHQRWLPIEKGIVGRADEPVQVKHEDTKGIIVFRWKLFDQVGIFSGSMDWIWNGRCKDELVVKGKCQ
jgi:hypothetical protein